MAHMISYKGELENKWNMSCVKEITLKSFK